MKPRQLFAALAMSVASASACAAVPGAYDTTSGVLLGLAVGGPVGLFLGGLVGGWLRRDRELEAELEMVRRDLAAIRMRESRSRPRVLARRPPALHAV